MALTQDELQKKLTEWQSKALKIPVSLVSLLNNTSSGNVYLKAWSPHEKFRRAGKALTIIWGIALFSIAIPIAHFVLVPTFLIAGPIVFLVVLNSENAILGGAAECPDCKQVFDISKSKVEWPIKDICSHCRHSVTINKA